MDREEEIIKEIDIVKKIVHKGLFPASENRDFFDYECLKVDLDSVLSLLLKVDMTDWTQTYKNTLFKYISTSFIMFLEKYISRVHIDIYYNMNEYKKFVEIYPDWCKDRMKRYKNTEILNLVEKILIRKLEKLKEMKSNFDIIKCDDSPIISIHNDLKISSKSTVVFSRDPHFMCLLAYYNIAIFNGRFITDRFTYYMEKEYPKVHYLLIPAFYMLCGIKRDEYVGVKGYAIKKGSKLINDNKIAVIKQTLPELQEVNKYRKIFYLNEL